MTELEEGTEFRVHGYVDVAGLDDGTKYRVKERKRSTIEVENLDTGEDLVIRMDEVEPYIGTKTYIKPLEDLFKGLNGFIGRIEVV